MGLGGLLAVSRFAYDALRILGAFFLMFLGTKIFFRARPTLGDLDQSESRQATEANSRERGLLTNILNPKVGVFYVTFLPQFVPSGVHVTSFSMLLAGIHATEGILWFAALTLAIGFGLELVLDNRRYDLEA